MARFLLRMTYALKTARNRSGDTPEGFDCASKTYRYGRLAGLR
jgi:hypothetical protein